MSKNRENVYNSLQKAIFTENSDSKISLEIGVPKSYLLLQKSLFDPQNRVWGALGSF